MRILKPDLRRHSCERFDVFMHVHVHEGLLAEIKSLDSLKGLGAKQRISINSFYVKDHKKVFFTMAVPRVTKAKEPNGYCIDVSSSFLASKPEGVRMAKTTNAPFDLLRLLVSRKRSAAILAARALFTYSPKKYKSKVGLPARSELSAGLEFEMIGTLLRFKEESGDIAEYVHAVDVGEEGDISHMLMFGRNDADLKADVYTTTLGALSDRSTRLLSEGRAEE